MDLREVGPQPGPDYFSAPNVLPQRIVPYLSMGSKNADQISNFLAEMQASRYGHLVQEPIYTDEDRDIDEQVLYGFLGHGDLLVAAGGDGTPNRLIKPLLELSPFRQVAVLAIAFGDANDFAVMTNGDPKKFSFEDTVASGKYRDISPVKASFFGGEYPDPIYGFSYIGAGKIAELVDVVLDSEEYREAINGLEGFDLLKYQMRVILPHMRRRMLGEVTIREEGASYDRKVHDISVINGSRMAKVATRIRSDLQDDRLLLRIYENGNLAKSLNWLGGLALGYHPNNYIEPGEAYKFLTHDPVTMHADAEKVAVAGGTFITIEQDKGSIPILGTALK